MTPLGILFGILPVLAMALAIVLVPLLADGRPQRPERGESLPSPRHNPTNENASASTHMQMAIADVHLAKVR
jgi:hypothetical protein